MMRATPILALALALAACATGGTVEDPTRGVTAGPGMQDHVPAEPAVTERERAERELLGECDASAAQKLLGERASAELGQRLLQLTGARILRWAPPNTALTMDFRPDRLTVSYDEDYVIERISCG